MSKANEFKDEHLRGVYGQYGGRISIRNERNANGIVVGVKLCGESLGPGQDGKKRRWVPIMDHLFLDLNVRVLVHSRILGEWDILNQVGNATVNFVQATLYNPSLGRPLTAKVVRRALLG